MSDAEPGPDRVRPVETDGRRAHVDWLKEQIGDAIRDHRLAKEDLWQIYSVRAQTFLSDNNRIWTMAGFILPVAFGLVSLVQSGDFGIGQKVLAGASSTALLVLWNLFSDHHRAFQQKADAWMRAIEEIHGIGDPGPPKAGLPRPLSGGRLRIQNIRWYSVLVLIALWVVALIVG